MCGVKCIFTLPFSEEIKSLVPLYRTDSTSMHIGNKVRTQLVQECPSHSFKLFFLAFILSVIKHAFVQINRDQLAGAPDKPLYV